MALLSGAIVWSSFSCRDEPFGPIDVALLDEDFWRRVAEEADAGSSVSVGASSSSSSTGGAEQVIPSPFEGWIRLPGVPGDCEVYYAENPAKLPPLRWSPCPEGTPGCSDLVVDWTEPDAVYFNTPTGGGVAKAGPYLGIRRLLGFELRGWDELVIAYVDGPVVAAIRSRSILLGDHPRCAVGIPGGNAERVVFNVYESDKSDFRAEWEVDVLLSGGPPTVFNMIPAELVRSATGAQMSPGDGFAAIGSVGGGHIYLTPRDGTPSSAITPRGWSAENPYSGYSPISIGRDVLYNAWHRDGVRQDVYHVDTGVIEPLIHRPDADVHGVATDGHTLIWLHTFPPEALRDSATHVELWTSPYAATPAGLAPRKLADLERPLWNSYTHMQAGHVVLRRSWGGVRENLSWGNNIVLRMRDLMFWSLDAPYGMAWGDTFYVTPQEVAFSYHVWGPQTGGMERTRTIRRQRLDALGEPRPFADVNDWDPPPSPFDEERKSSDKPSRARYQQTTSDRAH